MAVGWVGRKGSVFLLTITVSLSSPLKIRGFPRSPVGKESAYNSRDPIQSLGVEDPLEKGMATYFSILA